MEKEYVQTGKYENKNQIRMKIENRNKNMFYIVAKEILKKTFRPRFLQTK